MVLKTNAKLMQKTPFALQTEKNTPIFTKFLT